MKKLVIASVFALTTVSFAQKGHPERGEHQKQKVAFVKNLSPEQQATLKTKRMTLALNLTKAQQDKVYSLNLEQAKERKKHSTNRNLNKGSNKPTLSPNEKYAQLNARLDKKIVHKQEMHAILSEKQFEKWEKIQHKHSAKKRHHINRKR